MMKILPLTALSAAMALLAGCATVPPPPAGPRWIPR